MCRLISCLKEQAKLREWIIEYWASSRQSSYYYGVLVFFFSAKILSFLLGIPHSLVLLLLERVNKALVRGSATRKMKSPWSCGSTGHRAPQQLISVNSLIVNVSLARGCGGGPDLLYSFWTVPTEILPNSGIINSFTQAPSYFFF